MITSKYLMAIVAVLLCVCLAACGFIVYAASNSNAANIPPYQRKLFGDDIITIDIKVGDEDWQSLLDNAQAKEWISGDLIINGEQISTVGIRTKGNSSLSQMGRTQSDRYSLQFKFNKYVKGQNFYGLDTFCINNLMSDTTYMKDYISYDIMNFIGVDTPLANYANVTVNGEDYGFFLALERYDKSFLDRVYSTSGGQLYNVKIQMGRRGDFEDMRRDSAVFAGARPDMGGMPGGFPDGGERDGMAFRDGGRGGFGGSGGGSLIYTDDEISSYPAIFENAIFNSNSDKDKQRVINSLKNLDAGTDLEKYFDVDAILRYFAAHTAVVNLDSYSSNMQQNYYLYECDGKITILPWDYNLAFGGFQSGSAGGVVNFPIDTPVSGVSMEDRPLLDKLLEVEEYREKYHDYLRQIVEGYFESGLFENAVMALDAKINGYVKNDVSAYFTHEQYEQSLGQLVTLGMLRAQSIKGQLDGSIPSTSNGQREDSSSLVDASIVNLSTLGSMMGGGGGERGFGGRPDIGGGMQDMELMQQAMQIIMEAGGEITDEVKTVLLEIGLTEEQIEMFTGMQNGFPSGRDRGRLPDRVRQPGGERGGLPGGNMPGGAMPDGGRLPGGSTDGGNIQRGMPGGDIPGESTGTPPQANIGGNAITVAVLLLLLVAAIIFVARPRKNMV
ncbi:MAG: CotH kinase family protein [Oscillospiraceae bacterium]|nr:CotH kinase family protein [Oscillospiraceae bacterium]